MTTSIGYALGAGSGLDIKALVTDLANAAKAPKETLLSNRETANQAKISGLAQVSSAIDSFASALSSLISGGTLFSQPSVSDANVFTASALPGSRLDWQELPGSTGQSLVLAVSDGGDAPFRLRLRLPAGGADAD